MDALITLPWWTIGFFTAGFGVIATWGVMELRASRLRREEDIAYRGTAALALAAVVSDIKLLKSEALTKAAHDAICERWQGLLRQSLDDIRSTIEEKHSANSKHRHDVRNSLHVIELVLTRIAPEIMMQVSHELRPPR